MPAAQTVPSTNIEMPPPFGFAPAPSPRWEPAVDFAARNIGALVALWKAKRPTRRALPAFRHFDDLELRPWADNLTLLDVESTLFGERSYRYRSVGPAAASVEGGNFTGLYLRDALSKAQTAPRVQLYDRALQTRAPVRVHHRIVSGAPNAAGEALWDAVALPLSHDRERADHLMVLTYVEAPK